MKALLLVDIQKDFLPGGALAVTDGDAVVPVANQLQMHFDLVVASQDWHPRGHGSFAVNHSGKQPGDVIDLNGLTQILWPVHCVQDTEGAAFAPGLNTTRFAKVFRKGTDPGFDSYSAFYDNGHRHSTGLGPYLKEWNVSELYLAGLATDYCVKFSALDAVKLGFKSFFIEEACRGVNRHPGDVSQAIETMHQAGVRILSGQVFPGRANEQ